MGNSQSITTPSLPATQCSSKRPFLLSASTTCLRSSPSTATFPASSEKHAVRADAEPILDISTVYVTKPHNTIEETYKDFIERYPEYHLTWPLDALRKSDFTRLDDHRETYVDYMGGALYPESLVRLHSSFLHREVMGNTHSVSNSSTMSSNQAAAARKAVLSFFRAPPEYTVVFTANASTALKLVGEAYPFTQDSSYVLVEDSHNSVHGIRQYAAQAGAGVHYIPSTPHGGVESVTAKCLLLRHRPKSARIPSLFALTGQSNISNSKNPLSLCLYAQSLGYHTLLDAAALAPTSVVSLADTPVDAMAVSFYKMFGYPTGVGALVVKKSFLAQLRRPWFAGGTVDVVQVPGVAHTMSPHIHEQFEDGTINYTSLPAITDGLHFLSGYLPFLPLRLSSLHHFLIDEFSSLRHANGAPVVKILSRRPTRRLQYVGEQSDCGSTLSLLFLYPDGTPIPNSLIAHAASSHRISLRTGCMCNPGGAAALLGLRDLMAEHAGTRGVTLAQLEAHEGRELGVVRISLGLASSWLDVRRVVGFARLFADMREVELMRRRWVAREG